MCSPWEKYCKLHSIRVDVSRYEPYDYKSGTSMAAPHVSGVAGLIKAKHPDYTNIQIKAAILYSIDVKSSLSGLLLTSGRINALKAISS